MYKVIKAFVHTTDNGYSYSVGDEFPRAGADIPEEVCEELTKPTKTRPYILLEKVEAETPRKGKAKKA